MKFTMALSAAQARLRARRSTPLNYTVQPAFSAEVAATHLYIKDGK
jgi:hypothetical protein